MVARHQTLTTPRWLMPLSTPWITPMTKRLRQAVAALVLSLAFISPVAAQAPSDSAASGQATEKSGPNPTPSFALVFMSTILILFIICKPSRKA